MLTLRRLQAGELSGGMCLPGNVYDRDGKILFRAGQTLAKEAMDTLPEERYVDQKWPLRRGTEGAAPEEPARSGGNQRPCARRHERNAWRIPLTVTIDQANEELAVARFRVRAQDISRGGFSFLFRQFIQPGSRVTVPLPMLPQSPIMHGIVRNCVLIEGMLHRVGVEFIGEEG